MYRKSTGKKSKASEVLQVVISINNMGEERSTWLSSRLLWFIMAIYPLIVIPNLVTFDFALGNNVYTLLPSFSSAPRYLFLALTAGLALIALVKLNPQFGKLNWELVALLAFLFFGLVATLLAPYPRTAWMGTPFRWTGFSTDLYCVLLFFLAWKTLNLQSIEILLRWMVKTAALVGLLAVLQYYGLNLAPYTPSQAGFISFGTMGNPNFLATFMVFVLPAAMLIFLYQRRTWLWLLSATLIYAGLLVSLTRGAWLAGVLVLLLVAGYVFWGEKKLLGRVEQRLDGWLGGLSSRKALLVLLVMFALVTITLAPARDGRLIGKAFTIPGEMLATARAEPEAGSQRVFIWQETLQLWLSSPRTIIFGLGPDHLIYAQIITPGGTIVDKAHNIFLERAVTMGIIALLAYLFFLATVIWRLFRLGQGSGFLLTVMFLSYFVQGQFNVEVVMIMPLFWITLGMAMACKDNGFSCGRLLLISMTTVFLVNKTTGEVLTKKVKIVDDFKGRLKGLMFTETFPAYGAVIIKPCRGIHTFFMRYPLDILLLDEENLVIYKQESLPPGRVTPLLSHSKIAVELPAGSLKEKEVSLGDELETRGRG